MPSQSLESLLFAWLHARSIARGVPLPVPDRGGFRVDTGSDKEVCRWVFARDCEGLRELGRQIAAPRHPLKLLAEDAALQAILGDRWVMAQPSFVMIGGASTAMPCHLPSGYTLEQGINNAVAEVRILAADGTLAASGYGAEANGTFVYDRIVTQPEHMRRGLGTLLMDALSRMCSAPEVQQLLVATPAGRTLYEKLGWRVVAPYATASLPDFAAP